MRHRELSPNIVDRRNRRGRNRHVRAKANLDSVAGIYW